jgi:hypothetical protein
MISTALAPILSVLREIKLLPHRQLGSRRYGVEMQPGLLGGAGSPGLAIDQ